MTYDQQRAILSLTEAKGILRERGENYCAILIADAIEIISALRAASEGFVLVPVELTDEMFNAGLFAPLGESSADFVHGSWAAMLAARPQGVK
ncbi:hypothetical protein ATCM_03695 [Stenotrophomonas sp. ATCM1_4]|uniref:hypothetical protein n=1 Tax=Stenotrophomonas sp. ATCM1_4 TaxID=2259330 RepID=UPI00104B95EF|nr:hypothetical protein [Stenotrophomonas sp. ATCM1_4]TDB26821.1 hypothetical protein ATCM_03695 [Stenotrophomonas sp. ATCM1_4]